MDKNIVEKKRQTNLEFLRIIAMIMVVTLHFMTHGGVLENAGMFTKQYYFSWFIESISIVAVNCYVMISGYFLVESKFRIKKAVILIGEVIFYSLIIYFLLLAAGMRPFSKKEMLTAFIPTLTNVYGFFTIYICMYILSPFVNLAIKAMTKRQLLTCIIVELAFFSVWTNVVYFSPGLSFGGGWGIVWYIVLYTVAAYLRLYYKPSHNTKKLTLIYVAAALLLPFCKFLLDFVQKTSVGKYINQDTVVNIFFSYNSIPAFLSTVTLFILFLNINIKNTFANKIILSLSPLTFGVYLIHDNPYIRESLWGFINPPAYLYKWHFPLFMAAVIISIYTICSLIESIRKRLFDKINSGTWFDRFCGKIESILGNFVTWIEHFTPEK